VRKAFGFPARFLFKKLRRGSASPRGSRSLRQSLTAPLLRQSREESLAILKAIFQADPILIAWSKEV
jgi:hypothetical protein